MENAYKIAIYLNDHCALDGGTPLATAVLVGALVCLTRQKVKAKFWQVRYKSTVSKAKHLNVEKYKEQILMHSVSQSKRKFIALFSNGNQKATVKDTCILCQDSNLKMMESLGKLARHKGFVAATLALIERTQYY